MKKQGEDRDRSARSPEAWITGDRNREDKTHTHMSVSWIHEAGIRGGMRPRSKDDERYTGTDSGRVIARRHGDTGTRLQTMFTVSHLSPSTFT